MLYQQWEMPRGWLTKNSSGVSLWHFAKKKRQKQAIIFGIIETRDKLENFIKRDDFQVIYPI